MTAETDLLPLPEPFAWVNPHEAEDFIDGEDHHFTALRRGVPDGDFPIYSAEQVRACVSSATEALRAEVAKERDYAAQAANRVLKAELVQRKAEARAERLAEALRIAEAALADIGDADREPGDDVVWCERRAAQALPTVRAALDQEAGHE